MATQKNPAGKPPKYSLDLSRAPYAGDAPISKSAEDSFGRLEFAKRVAALIAPRHSADSVVLGIYEPWGEGKTSVLHLVHEVLRESGKPHIVSSVFNPWITSDETSIVIDFFETLVSAFAESNPEKLPSGFLQKVKKYAAKVLSTIQVNVLNGAISLSPFQFLTDDSSGTGPLSSIRRELVDLLKSAKLHVVVLIDDLDRLTRGDILAVFRALKILGDLPYTTYVVAMDPVRVGEILEPSSPAAAARYLEKIVQVPLVVPAVDVDSLSTFVFESMETVLKATSIELSEEQGALWGTYYLSYFRSQVTTLRAAKRLLNTWRFGLNSLGDEVNLEDTFLCEGMKCCYPSLFAFVQGSRDLLSGAVPTNTGTAIDALLTKQVRDAVDYELNKISAESRTSARDLLAHLFPKVQHAFGQGSRSIHRARLERRVCDPTIFDRFFSQRVPHHDFGETALGALREVCETGDLEQVKKAMKESVREANTQSFCAVLQGDIDKGSWSKVGLTKLIKTLAAQFPQPGPARSTIFFSPRRAFTMLLNAAIARLGDRKLQEELVEHLVVNAKSADDSLDFYWMFVSKRSAETIHRYVKSRDVAKRILSAARTHVEKYLDGTAIVYLDAPQGTAKRLICMLDAAGKDVTADALVRSFGADKKHVLRYLSRFVYLSTDMSTFRIQRGIRDDQYEVATRYVSSKQIAAAVKRALGKKAKALPQDPDYMENTETEDELLERLGIEFLQIYNARKKVKKLA